MIEAICARMQWLLILLLLPACVGTRTFIDEEYREWTEQERPYGERVLRVFLVGDAGGVAPGSLDPVLHLLNAEAMRAGEEGVVVYLGDNAYCCGLPPEGNPGRDVAEQRLRMLLDAVRDIPGRVVIIPGNHDWNDGREGGLAAVRRQEAYVENYLGRDNAFVPSGGFPGPVEVELSDQVRLIALDTQWWLHRHERAFGEAEEYEIEEDADFILEVDDLLRRRDDEDLLVVGHHPLYSNGFHSGYVSFRRHLFPLTDLHPRAVIPAPFLGSLYPLYLRYFGGRQDLPNGRYRELREALGVLFETHERLIYAAAHDHSLQYFEVEEGQNAQHHIISGSASRPEEVARGRGAAFVSGDRGFAVLDYFDDGQVWMEMWTPGEGGTPDVLFRHRLQPPLPERVDQDLPPASISVPDFADSSVVAAVNPRYAAVGPVRRLFWGNHNRTAWGTPVSMPVLDLGRAKGGLTPLQRGGGMQTLSLRLEGGDGHEYVLRTIDKDPSLTVPPELQGTVATDIVQDQIASLHPYGVFIVPPLARAAGVFHTEPALFYVPSDPRLGIYREQFADRVMMLEERPTDDMSDRPNFGGSSEVVGAGKLYREIDADNDHRVDQLAFARVRLFDMWISDWDRHRDQWRWAAYEPYELIASLSKDSEEGTQGKIYRPIPRDRDFAFNQLDGVFPSLAGLFDNKFQDFDRSYGSIRGLTKNGFEQDRRFTNELSKAEWLALADTLKSRLTDTVIESAVREWSAPIYDEYGARTIRLLKHRRDRLPHVAARMYAMHARTVDVVGSNKHERFEVNRLDDERTEVVGFKIKEGEKAGVFYQRTFDRDETKEIRLYGLDGDDHFIVAGDVGRGITVRAIGGGGEDLFEDTSNVRGGGRKSIFYDSEEGNRWETGRETKVIRLRNPAVNRYDPKEYKQDFSAPQVFFGSNKDDGTFIGGGVKFTRFGFRKVPYAATHRIVGNVAAKTGAFNIVYEGYFRQALGRWDAALDLSYLSPDNIRNFYGLGNETEDVENDRRYYRARLTQADASLGIVRTLVEGAEFRFGPTFQFVKVREDDDFIGQLSPRERIQQGITENTFDDQWYAGGMLGLRLGRADDPVNPKLGMVWDNSVDLNVGVRNATDTYATLSSSVTFYLTLLRVPQMTLASRAGVAHNIGEFPFFGANTLGGKDNLRGYRSTRFAGRTSSYQNIELRLGLFDYSTYLANGRAGVLGFLDNGRVWADGESSHVWHQGYGGGIWTALFDMVVLTGTAGFSEDDRTITVRLGFLY